MNVTFREIKIERLLLLGVLWGLIEVFVGKGLRMWQPAFFAFVMPFLIALFIIWAKSVVPNTGSLLGMAVIAALIKWFASGMILHGAFMAILIEAILAELAFLILDFSFLAFCSVGVLLQLYSLLHPYLVRGNLCQTARFLHFKEGWENLFYSGQDARNSTILAALIFVHLVTGLLAALLIWPLLKNRKSA